MNSPVIAPQGSLKRKYFESYDKADMIAAKLGGLFAMIVAMSPTNFNAFSVMTCSRINTADNAVANTLHYISASLLFLTFAFFSLILFTKSDHGKNVTKEKKTRNGIYKTCGWIIIFCIASIAAFSFIPSLYKNFEKYKPTYAFETIALLAFGFSWLIKGETFFKDK